MTDSKRNQLKSKTVMLVNPKDIKFRRTDPTTQRSLKRLGATLKPATYINPGRFYVTTIIEEEQTNGD